MVPRIIRAWLAHSPLNAPRRYLLKGGDRIGRTPEQLGRERLTERHEDPRRWIAGLRQCVGALEEEREGCVVTVRAGEHAEMEKNTHLAFGIVDRFEGSANLLELPDRRPVAIARLQIDHRREPLPLDTVDGEQLARQPRTEVGHRRSRGLGREGCPHHRNEPGRRLMLHRLLTGAVNRLD